MSALRRPTETSVLQLPVPTAQLEASVFAPGSPRGSVIIVRVATTPAQAAMDAFLAGSLAQVGFTSIVADLLAPREAESPAALADLRTDVDFLGRRLRAVVHWVADSVTAPAPAVGLVATGLTAAAAMFAAAANPERVRSLVCRTPRLDAARFALRHVHARTLLQVGEHDPLFGRCTAALGDLPPLSCLDVIDGAGDDLDQPAHSERLTQRAAGWLAQSLAATDRSRVRTSVFRDSGESMASGPGR